MHPHELVGRRGNINPRLESETSGLDWLLRVRSHFERVVWINPEPPAQWPGTQTTNAIGKVFPMFHLSVDGIEEAVSALVGSRPVQAAS